MTPSADQRAQVLARRHVLVVEGDGLAAAGERRAARRGRPARRARTSAQTSAAGSPGDGREHPQRLAQRDRGLVRHPGELPAADHADDGQAVRSRCCGVHGVGTYARRAPVRAPGGRSGTMDRWPWSNGAGDDPAALSRLSAIKHRELVKFAVVGGTTWVIDTAVFLGLKSTVLEPKPLTAKIIAVLVATIVSYVLNREWSFRTRGGRERHHEAAAVLPHQRDRRRGLHRPAGHLPLRAPPAGAEREPAHRGGRRLRQRPDPRCAGRHGVPLVGVPPVRVPARGRAQPGPRSR